MVQARQTQQISESQHVLEVQKAPIPGEIAEPPEAPEAQLAQSLPEVRLSSQEVEQVLQRPETTTVITVKKPTEGVGCSDIKLNFDDPTEPLAIVNIMGTKEVETVPVVEPEKKKDDHQKIKRKARLRRGDRSWGRRSRERSMAYSDENSGSSSDSGVVNEVGRLAEKLYHSKLCHHSSTHAVPDDSNGNCCNEASDSEDARRGYSSRSKRKRRGRTMRHESHSSTLRCSSCGHQAQVSSDLHDDGLGNCEARVSSIHKHDKHLIYKSDAGPGSGSPEQGIPPALPALPPGEEPSSVESPQNNGNINFGTRDSGQGHIPCQNGPSGYADGPAVYASLPSPDRRARFGEPIYIDTDGRPFTYTRQCMPRQTPYHGGFSPHHEFSPFQQSYIARYPDGVPIPLSQDMPPHPYLMPHQNFLPYSQSAYPIPPPHWQIPHTYYDSHQAPSGYFTGSYHQRYGTRTCPGRPSGKSRSRDQDMMQDSRQNGKERCGSSQWNANGNQSSGWGNGDEANATTGGGNERNIGNATTDDVKGSGGDNKTGGSSANDAWGDVFGKGTGNYNWGWAINDNEDDGGNSTSKGVDNQDTLQSNTGNIDNGNNHWTNWGTGNTSTGDSWTGGGDSTGNGWGNDEAKTSHRGGNRKRGAQRSNKIHPSSKHGKKKVSWGEHSETVVNTDHNGDCSNAADNTNADCWGDSGGSDWCEETHGGHKTNETNNNVSWGGDVNENWSNSWSNTGATNDTWDQSSNNNDGGGYKDPWIDLDSDTNDAGGNDNQRNDNNVNDSNWARDYNKPDTNSSRNKDDFEHANNDLQKPGSGDGRKRRDSGAGHNIDGARFRNWTAKDQALACSLNAQLKPNPFTDQWSALQQVFFEETGKFVTREELAYHIAGIKVGNKGSRVGGNGWDRESEGNEDNIGVGDNIKW
ncbi:uncharacterized protein SPSK_01014 [Sporothrix schenckii 1099-18]|uniref:Uncharacterized protein n=1 Tax=Sporothrix schenckii 1099-18 TaxID=1397361 RepID=A0A0F2LZ87_SPOSC|nr:uncharacterized protein SPSK_01014 [Sporothrix schenckii 1099-18]KJR81206.1 hypothetical protein SPSK_01014 [Sporothrix schenckii 1099-18]